MLPSELVTKVQGMYSGEESTLFSAEEREIIKEEMRALIAEELDCPLEEIEDELDFEDMGMDSVSFLQVLDELKRAVKLAIPTGRLLSYAKGKKIRTLNETVDLITRFLESQGEGE